jgi:hypothetical protein
MAKSLPTPKRLSQTMKSLIIAFTLCLALLWFAPNALAA